MLTQHKLSAAFPSMSDADFQALAEDIALNGLKQPVVIYEEQVLDGWHRYAACVKAGMTPKLTYLEQDEDPVSFVLSMNMNRRHLTVSQRAAAVVACNVWRGVGSNQHDERVGNSAEALAEMADVSERTIRNAKAAEEAGLGELVRDGELTAKRAADVAKLPKRQRAAAIKNGPPKKEEAPPAEGEDEGRALLEEMVAELTADLSAAERVIEGDNQLAAAWLEVKAMRAKHDAIEKLYNLQRTELGTMTREAAKWKRLYEELKEKGL